MGNGYPTLREVPGERGGIECSNSWIYWVLRWWPLRSLLEMWNQARNQLGTPGGAKSFLRGAPIFWAMSNIFKLYPTHFSRGGEKYSTGASPLWLWACVKLEGMTPDTP